ncbi:uncharacterized protein LOC141906678 [Tubulanus polymorphus]|uniref:uncharacterized protein LOC141906678 n=1 Tax=Tubulanus polymorphus TaxID=672921 RepID=UPI003DA43152
MADDDLDGGVLLLNFRGLSVLPAYLTKTRNYGNIKRLYLKRNLLTSLPANISNLCNLVELYICDNDLSSLPDAIGDLKCLVSLNVDSNKLEKLPDSIDGLTALRTLSLARNKFRFVPSKIWQLPNLRVLDLTGNDLRRISLNISHTGNAPVKRPLERLVLDRNRLEVLPRQICALDSLQEISAVGNCLRCIPLDLGYLKNLGSVLVDGNRTLNVVPISLTAQKLGINGCARTKDSTCDNSMPHEFSSVFVPTKNDDTDELVHLPEEILCIGNSTNFAVVTLLELALRSVFLNFRSAVNTRCLPRNLLEVLSVPTASCISCGTPIFTMCFPVVFGGQLHDKYGVYRLGLCCTVKCNRLCPIRIQMPLVYPVDKS